MTREEFRNALINIYNDKSKYVILDTETTGLGKYDEIIEISIIDLDGNVMYDSLVKPDRRITYDAYKIHGISDEMVDDYSNFKEQWDDIYKVIKGKTIIAYNAKFDIRMIKQTLDIYKLTAPRLSSLCMMELCTRYKGFRPKLESFSTSPQTHRALGDTYIILNDIIKKYME